MLRPHIKSDIHFKLYLEQPGESFLCYTIPMTTIYIAQSTIHQLKHIQAQLDQLQPNAAPAALRVAGSPQPCETIVVFPGSFNPPTTAHLALLKDAQRFMQVHGSAPYTSHIYAAFSKRTVDKETVERPLLLERVHLLNVVLQRRLRHAGILLFNRGLYVEQAQAIHAAFPAVQQLFFLMGFDKIVQIFDPHYYTDRDAALVELFKLAKLLVAPRGGGGEQEIHALLAQPENVRFARYVQVLPFNPRYLSVSSTQIRQGDQRAWHDVPPEVRQFMRETRAYAAPLQLSDGTQRDYYAEHMQQLQQLVRADHMGARR